MAVNLALSDTIRGDHLVLRALNMADLDMLYASICQSFVELSPWMPWCHQRYSKDDTRQFLARLGELAERCEEFAFGIFDGRTSEFLGCNGINYIDIPYRRANLGYWIRSDRTGRGIASRSTRLLAETAMKELQLERIEIVVAIDNLASQRVAEKAGATREGILRQRIRAGGVQTDAICFSFIRADFGLPAVA
jgi:RimJ/RimL family protein N-acetyltransferase